MSKLNFRISQRAEAYYTGKEQIVKALTTLANHVHNPPKKLQRVPEELTVGDITIFKQAYGDICDAAEKLGLELPCLEL